MAKVLFQSMNPQLFRATFIGYLYEIARKHEVLLLIEKVDSDTQRLLHDKSIFPGLGKIIFFESAFSGNVFLKNYRLCKVLKKAVEEYRPDIAVTHSDMWPADMYVLRFAKKAGARTIAIQAGFRIAGERKLYVWSSLMNAYRKMPKALPFFMRLALAKAKKYAGHFFYYWILPLTAGEKPFSGKTSFVFWDDTSGHRDADYAAVFSKRDYDVCLKDGVKREKVFVIGHPLDRPAAREFFERAYFTQKGEREESKTLTIMWPDEVIGFQNDTHALIPEEEMRERRARVVALIAAKLADWKIFIKPHPAVKNAEVVRESLGSLPPHVSVVHPAEPADVYIARSSVIVGMPPPSTTLFTASRQSPEKIVLSLNLCNEFLGDSYKDFEGIEYVDSEERLARMLDAIRSGTYRKKEESGELAPFPAMETLLHIGAAHI